MNHETILIEKEAHLLLSQNKFEDAYILFKKSAETYRDTNNHKQAALCFASAASCWDKKRGEVTAYNAALSYENAALEAEKAGDFEYASLLYKHAAINHERDGESSDYSDCVYKSNEAHRKFLTYGILQPNRIQAITKKGSTKGLFGFIKRLFSCILLNFSYVLWGYGERPFRTILFVMIVIFGASFFYTFGYFAKGLQIVTPNFFEALYFSAVTFTTVGYGDLTPLGTCRFVAILEAFSSVFILPLFIIALTRKHLKI